MRYDRIHVLKRPFFAEYPLNIVIYVVFSGVQVSRRLFVGYRWWAFYPPLVAAERKSMIDMYSNLEFEIGQPRTQPEQT
jgi:hypothetical protein